MDEERRPTTMHSNPTRAMIIAWADAHSVDVSNAEADDLVRRLWYPPTPFDIEAVEKCVVEALLLLAEGEDHDQSTAESLRGLASQVSAAMLTLKRMSDGEQEPGSPSGIAEQADVEDDGAPGTTVGEPEGSLRFDAIYIKPVAVTLNGKLAKAIWPPSYGRVRLKLEGSRRPLIVALDELDDRSRRMLRDAKVRLRTEMVVRCRVAHCTQCFRAWMRPDGEVEDTKGVPLSEFGSLFAARCEAHKLMR